MKSDTGSLLTKIAAIINFVAAVIVAVIGIVIATLGSMFLKETRIAPLLLGLILIIVAIVVLILGLLELRAADKMKNPKTARNGAIWAIVLGAITIGNISGILALIGGIIGIIDADK